MFDFLIYLMIEAFHLKQLKIASVRPLNIRITHYNVVTYKLAYVLLVFLYVYVCCCCWYCNLLKRELFFSLFSSSTLYDELLFAYYGENIL